MSCEEWSAEIIELVAAFITQIEQTDRERAANFERLLRCRYGVQFSGQYREYLTFKSGKEDNWANVAQCLGLSGKRSREAALQKWREFDKEFWTWYRAQK